MRLSGRHKNNLNLAIQILVSMKIILIIMQCAMIAFQKLKPIGFADLTASTALDVFPHRRAIAERHPPCICGKLDNRLT